MSFRAKREISNQTEISRRPKGAPRNDTASQLVIGVDGGGTHTRARLANAYGEMLGSGEAGIANPHANGYPAAQTEILAAIQRAFDDAHIEKQMVAAVCLGIGGVDRVDERARLTEWAQQTIAPSARVMNDGEIVLAAGSTDNWGVALIAGTGSIAWGKSRDGRVARAGGWGYLIGDEGSGFDLAREALRAATHFADGRGAATHLLDVILDHWKLESAAEIVPQVYRSGLKPADIAKLAPLVIQVAEQGDAVAQELIKRGVNALADTVEAVAKQLEFREEKIPLALTGGLLLNAESLRAKLLEELKTRGDHFSPIAIVQEPVLGAVRLAMSLGS
ncbi:MAG: BadF/BadG/BcrA/BcrD type ATPase [Chloroflexi bacterium]|nr:BadF/BadG/BcrA/BcrD type ATPase [Chloroflexota bacterium]